MPAATHDVMDNSSDSILSNALRQLFRHLDIKDVTPEIIISRFSKSGGIDRVRIAIEHRMKDFLESHKRHTVSESEQYLNRVLSDDDHAVHPQKLMQQTQDVVLATVKDRIGKDIDSVTEQGKADWFLECIRDEIVNVIKEDDKVAKVEEEPLPSKPAIAGAKAILSNLTRTAVRARHTDHAHDSVKQGLNKDSHANGHLDDAANGHLNHNEKQTVVKGKEVRSEIPDEKRKEEMETVAEANSNRSKAEVALKSPKHKVKKEPVHKDNHASPGHTPATAKPEGKGLPSSDNAKVKREDKVLQSTKEDMEFDSLADKVLLGDVIPSDVEMTVEEKHENVHMPTETPMAATQSDSKATSHSGATEAASGGDRGREGLLTDTVMQSATPEKNKVCTDNGTSKVHAALKADDGDAENEGATSRKQESSEPKVAEGRDAEGRQQIADHASVPNNEPSCKRESGKADVRPVSEKVSIVEEILDAVCNVTKTEEEGQDEKNAKLDVDQEGEQAAVHKSIPEEEEKVPEPSQECKDKSKAGKESTEKAQGPVAKDGLDDATAKGTREAMKRSEPLDENDKQPEALKEHAMNSSRRSSRRITSRTPAKVDDAVDATEVTAERSGSQSSSKARKGKASKARSVRPARKNEEGTAESKTARKKARKEAPKDKSVADAKKRKRSPAGQGATQEVGQSSDRPDPAVENWPRGYGVTRSCVPDDYNEQKKVLLALEMVLKQECAEPFSEPVDTSEDGLEMYTNVIKNPMDLGEICRRLRNSSAGCGYYANVTEILQDVDLVWWNCREYNGQFDPVVVACERTQQELAFLLEQHGITVEKGAQKRRRVSRGRAVAPPTPEPEPDLGDNDGSLVGKSILIFTELKKRKKEWFKVDVKSYDKKTKSYSLFWEETGKTTKKATFGPDKVFPVYRA